ncbi:MAG: PspC domain-containing protein [Nostocoides sp.]
MSTPYQTRVAGPGPQLLRPRQGRWVAGVCQGLAVHLGWPVLAVRLGLVGLTVATGGAALGGYAFLWMMTPPAPSRGYAAQFARATERPQQAEWSWAKSAAVGLEEPEDQGEPKGRGVGLLLAGAGLLLLGAFLAARNLGVDLNASTLVPLIVIGGGAALAWSQLDDTQRSSWLGMGQRDRRMSAVRVLVGLLLTLTGIVVLIARGQSLTAIWDALLATVAVLAGAVLIGTPWIVRLWNDLRAEQLAAARARERADIAAHLHDSVLQTLALVQRRADDPTAVAQLARAQERELRAWLYAGPRGSQESLAAALADAAHEVEDGHGVPVELVITGDSPLTAGCAALAQAFREALLNATRHGRPPVSAYVEIGKDQVEAFVRDRGPGFDLDEVPEDRLGVRESILGRMERAGGSARVRRLDAGTEVTLSLPLSQAASA